MFFKWSTFLLSLLMLSILFDNITNCDPIKNLVTTSEINQVEVLDTITGLKYHKNLVRFGYIGTAADNESKIFETYEKALSPYIRKRKVSKPILKELEQKGEIKARYVNIDMANTYNNENKGIFLSLGFHNVSYDNALMNRWLSHEKRYGSKVRNLGFKGKKIAFSTHNWFNDSKGGDFLYMPKKDFELYIDEYNFIVFFSISLEDVKEKLKENRIFMMRTITLDSKLNFKYLVPL